MAAWLPARVQAQVITWYTWDSGDGSSRWDRPANWSGDAVPPEGASTGVAFGTGGQTTVNTIQSRTVAGLRFDVGAASFSILDNQLTFSSASGTASLIQASSQTQTLDASLNVISPLEVSVTGAGTMVISGKFAGNGTLTKVGTGGDLLITGNGLNFSGDVAVNQGTLHAASSFALGNTSGTTTVASGATLAVGSVNGTNLTFSESIQISGQGVGGGGALVNRGATNTLNGTLHLGADARLQSDVGTLIVNGGVTGTGRTLTVSGAGTTRFTSPISTGNGGLTKEGTGRLELASPNYYTGATAIYAGTVVLQAASVFSDTSLLTVAGGSLLDLNGFSETVGSLAGDGRIEFNGGKLTLATGASTFGGEFTGAGTLIIRAGASLTLTDSFNAPNLNILLDGGTLNLGNAVNQQFGNLQVVTSSIIDFGTSGATSVLFQNVSVGGGQVLTVNNWAAAVDYFFVQNNPGPQGTPPTNQVDFTSYPVDSWTGNDTQWIPFAHTTYGQLTPVPEPSTYGAVFLASALAWVLWRRRQAD